MSSYFISKRAVQIQSRFHQNQTPRSDSINFVPLEHNFLPPNCGAQAKLLKATLDPTLFIYFEYANEVWNWQFEVATYNLHTANASVLVHGDPNRLNYDNCSNTGYWAWRWAPEFGGQGMVSEGSRLAESEWGVLVLVEKAQYLYTPFFKK